MTTPNYSPSPLEVVSYDRSIYVAKHSPETGPEYDHALSVIAGQAALIDLRQRDITAYTWLPELPETKAYDVYERILTAERRLITPNHAVGEYKLGTAKKDNDLYISDVYSSGTLLTAEHATSPVKKIPDSGDMGTGGLAAILAEELGISTVIALGRQTVTTELTSGHATRKAISERAERISRFFAVHGMTNGKVLTAVDNSEIHAILGLGMTPNERTYEFAKLVKRRAKENLGLSVTLGEEEYLVLAGTPPAFKRNDDGTFKTGNLNAEDPKSTVTHVSGLPPSERDPRINMQVELTRFLRLLPPEADIRDQRTKVMGVYLGYCLMKDILSLQG